MGFSVTAANVIFFVAILSVAGTSLNVVWESASRSAEAKSTWATGVRTEVATFLTLTVNTCNSNCDPATVPTIRIDVLNEGLNVIDARNLTFLIDGRAYPFSLAVDHDIVSPTSVSGTDLILPGETMRIEFSNIPVSADYSTTDLPVMVVTREGAVGGR